MVFYFHLGDFIVTPSKKKYGLEKGSYTTFFKQRQLLATSRAISEAGKSNFVRVRSARKVGSQGVHIWKKEESCPGIRRYDHKNKR